jgi:3-deoxy-D-manno-octulosonic-acid transferase
MLWFIYNVLFAVGYVLMLPYFLARMWRRGGYRQGFLERFGIYPGDTIRRLNTHSRIWIHAVSVGEIHVALRFADELRTLDPETAFVITTTTSTGHAVAEKRLHPDDVLLYFPSDFPAIVNRVLGILRPKAIILTESELWPNLIRLAKKRNIPVILINGRISERSYKGYRMLKAFFSRIIRLIDLFLVQTAQEEKCLLYLGADKTRIKVLGTVKYDVVRIDPAGGEKAREILKLAGIGPDSLIVTGGSTWPGEERILLDIFKRLKPSFPRLRLVLVPRHAERREEVETEIRRSGLSYARRSGLDNAHSPGSPVDVLLVDSTGELMWFYACASIVFVGKSLTSHGGQNVIEPALLGKPIVVGPFVENFSAVVSDLLSARALIQIQSAAELEDALKSLLSDDNLRKDYGRHATSAVQSRQGVIQKSVNLIAESIQRSSPPSAIVVRQSQDSRPPKHRQN